MSSKILEREGKMAAMFVLHQIAQQRRSDDANVMEGDHGVIPMAETERLSDEDGTCGGICSACNSEIWK